MKKGITLTHHLPSWMKIDYLAGGGRGIVRKSCKKPNLFLRTRLTAIESLYTRLHFFNIRPSLFHRLNRTSNFFFNLSAGYQDFEFMHNNVSVHTRNHMQSATDEYSSAFFNSRAILNVILLGKYFRLFVINNSSRRRIENSLQHINYVLLISIFEGHVLIKMRRTSGSNISMLLAAIYVQSQRSIRSKYQYK